MNKKVDKDEDKLKNANNMKKQIYGNLNANDIVSDWIKNRSNK